MHVDHDVLSRLQTLLSDCTPPSGHPREDARPETGRVMGEPDESIDRFSPSSDWDRLIEQVQGVAQHFRTIEKRIQLREVRLEQLLGRAEEELNAAAERVRLAETRAVEIQAWADREVAEAARRTASTEERARSLDAVFAQLREIVLAETPREAEVVLFGRPKPFAAGGVTSAAIHKVA